MIGLAVAARARKKWMRVVACILYEVGARAESVDMSRE
jgi:hypothetical protein